MSESTIDLSLSGQSIYEEEYELESYDPVEQTTTQFYVEMIPSIIQDWQDYDDRAAIMFKNGNKYLGEVENLILQGEGEFTWSNGTTYTGNFEGNRPEGYGKLVNKSGTIFYEGLFRNGVKHGAGWLQGDQFIYEGCFQNGQFYGYGFLRSPGFWCEGEFINNRIVDGAARYQSGIFIGKFDENENRSYGKYYFIGTNDIYSGAWSNDLYNGFGKYHWYTPVKSCNSFIKYRKESYIGYWKNGLQHGIGVMRFQEKIIMCTWKNGKKHGPGFVIASNGDFFVSSKFFLHNQYSKCWSLPMNLNLKYKIQELLSVSDEDELGKPEGENKRICFDFEKSTYRFEKMPSVEEIFNSNIEYLMKFVIVDIPSETYPIFLQEFNMTDDIPYLDLMRQKLCPILLGEIENLDEWKAVEMKCLNQAIEENIVELQSIYREYIVVCGEIEEDNKKIVYMSRLGLWLFYWDLLRHFPKMHASQMIAEVENWNNMIVKNSRCATESVYFGQFLRHIIHFVTVLCCSNSFIAEQMISEGSINFGQLATMLLVFIREHRAVERFSGSHVVKIFQKNERQLLLRLFEVAEQFEDEYLSFRSIYRFLSEYREKMNFLVHVTDDDLFICGSKIFPNLMIENCCIQNSTFEVTPLEFWEVILLCAESNGHEKQIIEMESEIALKKSSSDTKTIVSKKKKAKL